MVRGTYYIYRIGCKLSKDHKTNYLKQTTYFKDKRSFKKLEKFLRLIINFIVSLPWNHHHIETLGFINLKTRTKVIWSKQASCHSFLIFEFV